jgi:hypothetical protein
MYLFAIILLSIPALLEGFNKEFTDKNKLVLALICYVFLIFHDGLRWETGSDWNIYAELFETINYNYDPNVGLEPGYYLFLKFIRFLSSDFSVYLIIHAITFYTIFFFAIFKLSDFPFISILIFYMITVPYMGMNRQFLAMSLYGLGLIFLIRNQKMYFLGMVLLAMMFHRTAIMGIFAVFLNRKIPVKYWVVLLGLALLISMSGIISTLSAGVGLLFSDGTASKKADFYLNNADSVSLVSSVLAVFRKTIWIILLFIFDSKVDNKDRRYYTFLNLYVLGVLFYILFNATPLQIIVSRAILYFNIVEIFVIPYTLTIFKANYGKLLIMSVLIAYCIVNIYKGFSNYGEGNDYFTPYKGLFINRDYVRQSI